MCLNMPTVMRSDTILDARLLHCIVLTGEELHLSRAAARLGITEAALQSELEKAERQLDTRLFIADAYGLQPTASGSYFIEVARKRLLQAELAIYAGLTTAPPKRSRLAYGPLVNPDLLEAMVKLRAHYGGVPELFSVHARDQIECLRKGVFNIGLLIESTMAAVGVEMAPLFAERLFAVLPARHELARRGEPVSLSELRTLPMISLGAPAYRHLDQHLRQICRHAGLEPRDGPEAASLAEAVLLTGQGDGFCLARECELRFARPEAVFLPLQGKPVWIHTTLAFRSGYRDAFLDQFLPARPAAASIRALLSRADSA